MMDMQRIVVDDRIRALRREAAESRTRPNDVARRSPDAVAAAALPATAAAVTSGELGRTSERAGHAGSPRLRLGRWLVGIGTAIAGSDVEPHRVTAMQSGPATPAATTAAAAGAGRTRPCDDHAPYSHAA